MVGMGSIGSDIARMAIQGFQMHVLGLRSTSSEIPSPLKAMEGGGPGQIEMVSPNKDGMAKLLRESDYVVLCMPQTNDSVHTIGASELASMKSSAVIANVGRGSAIDCVALAEALREGQIHGAALDVVEQEPLDAVHPLWQVGPDKLLLSPHTADLTEDYWPSSVAAFRANLKRMVEGEPLVAVVNPSKGY